MTKAPTKCNVSLVITAWNEAATVDKALGIYAQEAADIMEVLIVCPDRETQKAAEKHREAFQEIHVLQDPQQGKQEALNIAMKHATGDICMCTDGDVLPQKGAIAHLRAAFQDKTVGITTGRPYSTSPRTTMFGFWSQFLVQAAHQYRTKQQAQEGCIVASGYLLAFRRTLWTPIPHEVLSDDAFISYSIHQLGYRTTYTPNAGVDVAYPTHYKDWFAQKRRSQGGFTQLSTIMKVPHNPRSAFAEITGGLRQVLTFPKSLREYWWMSLLCLARVHVWIQVWHDKRKNIYTSKNLWTRIESTKEHLQ